MKKLTLCFLIMLFALLPLNHEWSYGEKNTREKDTLRILTSFYPIYIAALNVTKNVPGVAVTNLTPLLTGCLHDYSLTTKDMKKFAGSDIFVANGAGMESFLDRTIKRYPAVKVIQLSKGILLIKGAGDEENNPHVWVSISNTIIQVKNLNDALQKIDPDHKIMYQKNTDEYVLQLETLRRKIHAALQPYQGEKIVTFHEAFPYFAQEFGLEIATVVEREPGSQPNARELAETIELVKRSKIKALFAEPQYPALSAQTIAQETGARVYILDPAVTGPEQADAYLRIMEKNLATLEKALKN